MRHQSYTLECTPDAFKARTSASGGLVIVRATTRDAARCGRLWTGVGAGFWTGRVRWSPARWVRHLRQPDVSFWIARSAAETRPDEDVGCFELIRLVRGTKIQGFGLLPPSRGRGLGRDLLTAATMQAFATGARKVWLHTATDDHPAALPNYLAGGYRIVRTRELRNPMPAPTPPPGERRVV
ncbi:MAG: GNAT family N-acetyltransferase [Phycisphaerales bacterium]|nr:GNAT family N-acetyltransferase [Phycisphaerales bacterium]